MYLKHFGLKHDPLGKDIRDMVESAQQNSLNLKLNWLLESKSTGLITGDAGTGKTTALRQWASTINPMTHKVFYQSDNHFRAFDIYSQFADALGLDRCHRYSQLWRKLKAELLNMHDNKQVTPIWILDEAHHLPKNFLHELPSFLNFSFDSKNVLIIVLCGLPTLKATLNKSFYSAFTSRMLFQFSWQAIDELEAFSKYVIQAFKNAGKQESIISQSGMQMLHMASKGKLRHAHRIMTISLHTAAMKNLNHLPDDVIQNAIEEIQS